MDSSRLRTGEIVAGIGGLALFVFLFFDWFGGGGELTGSPGNLTLSSTGISGWDALTDLPGFLIILSGVSGIALSVLAAAGQRLAITVGALMALAEDGFEVLVAVPGGRPRTAPASAPPATPSPPSTAAATAPTSTKSGSSGGKKSGAKKK